MKSSSILVVILALVCPALPGCYKHEEHGESAEHKIVVTVPKMKDVIITQQYVCQIHSQRHIKVRALQAGYLEAIPVKEGQLVKAGEVMFHVIPALYKAKFDAESAEANFAEMEFVNTKSLADKQVVSDKELKLYEAKMLRAQAKAKLAETELNFTKVVAPFDGIMDRQHEQQGSLIKEGDVLTTLSDNSLMWVYFNVPEARYLEYMAAMGQDQDPRIELKLANGTKFNHTGKIGAIEARFNNETGTVPFRADFPNPDRTLRHGMTGNVLINKKLHSAMVIPQRATYEILEKRFVWVVGKDNIAHPREIKVLHELENIFVIRSGLEAGDKFVLEGVRQVHDGQQLDPEFCAPDDAMAHQNYPAE